MSPRWISRQSAIAGTAIWIAWQLLADVFEPVGLFVLSPLVLVPLLLSAVVGDEDLSAAPADAGPSRDDRPLLRALSWAQLPCALGLPLAFSLEPGAFALLASLPWFAWTAMAAVEGARRVLVLIRHGGWRGLFDGELAIAAGLGFPVVGGVWLLCDRLAIEPLGFSPLIVLLTAAHFHHAGLTLPLGAGLLARWFGGRLPWRVTAVAIPFAVPLVAMGITFSPALELVAALLTASAGIAVGIGMLLRSVGSIATVPSVLSALSGASLLAAMTFAGSYAIGEYHGVPWPDISAMIRLHGAVNALGFGLLGAWSWQLSPPRETGHSTVSITKVADSAALGSLSS